MVTKSEKIVSLNKTITANLRLTAASFFLACQSGERDCFNIKRSNRVQAIYSTVELEPVFYQKLIL